ncbi:MAG: hypothetical protein R3B06_02415 [Kofleriaceae bacterium]
MSRFEPEVHARLRRGLLDRGQALATKLAALLAGADADRLIRALGLDARPGARPEEVLRAALDQVEARRRLLDSDDDRFGRCDVCGVALAPAALAEMPWADRCAAHPVVVTAR